MTERTVLLIAFHFPPIVGSSGVQRTLRFSQHLSGFGWRPIVLSIVPSAYEASGSAAGNEIPADVEVHRAFGMDAARRVSIAGRYPRLLATPDRWATWRYWAVRKALRIIRERSVTALFSTFPIATAHRVGLDVASTTGLPWVAEFRDPMWQGDYPEDQHINAAWRRLEEQVFARANRVVVTTPSAVDTYARRFPGYPRGAIELIENGFDEETFRRAAVSMDIGLTKNRGPVTLLHSGIVYRSERDPRHLFEAISRLKRAGRTSAAEFQLLLRASGDTAGFRADIERHAIDDIVRLEPGVDYLAALQEMMSVDGLLLLQASNCNAQVPAKLYEYLRAGRPIVALTDPAGDTARTLEQAGTGILAPLDSPDEIVRALLEFMAVARSGDWRRPPPERVAGFSRQSQAGQLARLLDGL